MNDFLDRSYGLGVIGRGIDAHPQLARVDADDLIRHDSAADMGADIEHPVTTPHEAAIEPIHRHRTRPIAVVDAK